MCPSWCACVPRPRFCACVLYLRPCTCRPQACGACESGCNRGSAKLLPVVLLVLDGGWFLGEMCESSGWKAHECTEARMVACLRSASCICGGYEFWTVTYFQRTNLKKLSTVCNRQVFNAITHQRSLWCECAASKCAAKNPPYEPPRPRTRF